MILSKFRLTAPARAHYGNRGFITTIDPATEMTSMEVVVRLMSLSTATDRQWSQRRQPVRPAAKSNVADPPGSITYV
jgi:hypothetical protein